MSICKSCLGARFSYFCTLTRPCRFWRGAAKTGAVAIARFVCSVRQAAVASLLGALCSLPASATEQPDGWLQDKCPCDKGGEPDPCVNTPMWESEDIWIRNNQDGGTIHQNPLRGQTNYVYVRFRSRGTTSVAGDIRVYFAAASTGLPWNPILANWGFTTGPLTGDFIGSQPVGLPGCASPFGLSDPCNSSAPCPDVVVWIPWTVDANLEFHSCLLARFISTTDPMFPPGEGTDIWLNTYNNNNIAWRNLIVEGETGITPPGDRFLVRNVKNVAADVDLVFDAGGGGGGIPFVGAGSVRIALAPQMFTNWMGAGGQGQGIVALPAESSVALTSAQARIQGIPMGPAETQPATMYFTPNSGITNPAFQRYVVSQFSDGQTTPDGGITFEFRFRAASAPTLSGSGLLLLASLLLAAMVMKFGRKPGSLLRR